MNAKAREDGQATEPVCTCDEAVQNRWRMKRDYPHAVAPTMPPNDDGEIVCAFCWEVIGRG